MATTPGELAGARARLGNDRRTTTLPSFCLICLVFSAAGLPALAGAPLWTEGLAPGTRLELRDARGALLHQQRLATDGGLLLPNDLPVGIYLVRMLDGTDVWRVPVVAR